MYYVTSQPSQPKSFQYQLTFTEIFADISAYQGEFTEFTIQGNKEKRGVREIEMSTVVMATGYRLLATGYMIIIHRTPLIECKS